MSGLPVDDPYAALEPAPPPLGRRPTSDQVRIYTTANGRTIRFVLSEDIVLKLIDMFDDMFGILTFNSPMDKIHPLEKRLRWLRMSYVRMTDAGVPGVLLRIEEPTYTPRGTRIWRQKGRAWSSEIRARRIGVRDNIPAPRSIEPMWADDRMMRGIILMFEDSDMIAFPGKTPDARKLFGYRSEDGDLHA